MWELVWPHERCLSVRPFNRMRYKEDVVSAWKDICDVLHQIREKVPNVVLV